MAQRLRGFYDKYDPGAMSDAAVQARRSRAARCVLVRPPGRARGGGVGSKQGE